MDSDRIRLRATFDTVADRYQDARPDYPGELYEELIRLAGLAPGSRLLEIGCATGKATLPLARRGYPITCLEIGPALAAAARRVLAPFPAVEVISTGFEGWQPERESPFHLIFAATAWHWLDPGTRYRKAWRLLRPGGHLAFWTAAHVFPAGGDPFFREIQDVYDEIGAGKPPGGAWPAPGELPDEAAGITGSGLFTVTGVREFDWEVSYAAEDYIRLLGTFSSHLAMAQWQRDRLYGEIRRRLSQRPDGRVRRGWGAVLHVARRRDDPGP